MKRQAKLVVSVSNWRTVGVRLKEEQVGIHNQPLKQLVEDLAEALADKIVVKMTTTPELGELVHT